MAPPWTLTAPFRAMGWVVGMRYFVICWLNRLRDVQFTADEARALIELINSRVLVGSDS